MPFVELRCFAFALTLLAGVQARAASYYISPAGSDSNDGTAPDSAWQTVGRVNRVTLSALATVSSWKAASAWWETCW